MNWQNKLVAGDFLYVKHLLRSIGALAYCFFECLPKHYMVYACVCVCEIHKLLDPINGLYEVLPP